MTTKMTACCLAAASICCVLTRAVFAQQDKIPAVSRAALLKLAEPWPDAAAMRARKSEAENRPLFGGTDVFPLTLAADFKVINKDRSVEGKKDYTGTMTVPRTGGGEATLHVKLRTRGHFRLRASSCSFVPLRVEFTGSETPGTIFEGQKSLKLVTHCREENDYEQYIRREYLAYRASNILTPKSFRARLAKATYQLPNGQQLTSRLGMFLEDDDDVARRMEGRIADLPRSLFKDVDRPTLATMMIFEYMIGNTDFSMYALHNVKLVRTPDNVTHPVPYDFDLSGLVDTIYAGPDRTLGIKTVKERLFRGPCQSATELEPVLQNFRSHKTDILALYDSMPELSSGYRRDAKEYLSEFFRLLDRQGDVKRAFVDGMCTNKSTM